MLGEALGVGFSCRVLRPVNPISLVPVAEIVDAFHQVLRRVVDGFIVHVATVGHLDVLVVRSVLRHGTIDFHFCPVGCW